MAQWRYQSRSAPLPASSCLLRSLRHPYAIFSDLLAPRRARSYFAVAAVLGQVIRLTPLTSDNYENGAYYTQSITVLHVRV